MSDDRLPEDPMLPPELRGFVAAARSGAEEDLEAATRPGIDALFARLDAHADGDAPHLDDFAEAARDEAQRELAAVQTREIPARRVPERPVVAPARARPAWTWVAAAAILLAGGIAMWQVVSARAVERVDASQAVMEQPRQPSFEGSLGDVRDAAPSQATSPPKAPADEERTHDEETASSTKPVEEGAAPTRPPSSRQPTAAGADTAPSLDARLAALDAEAQAAWRRGEHEAARAAFEEIVRRGGRRAIVETAYGELLTLARQDGEDERPLWRAYLKRFPRGRHADDARGGLCRSGVASEVQACWSAYLEDFPSGAHRREAEAAAEGRGEASQP